MRHQTFGKIANSVRSASFHSSRAKDSSRVNPAEPSFLRQTKTSTNTLQINRSVLHDLPLRHSLRTGLESLYKIHNPLDIRRPLGSNEDIEPCE